MLYHRGQMRTLDPLMIEHQTTGKVTTSLGMLLAAISLLPVGVPGKGPRETLGQRDLRASVRPMPRNRGPRGWPGGGQPRRPPA